MGTNVRIYLSSTMWWAMRLCYFSLNRLVLKVDALGLLSFLGFRVKGKIWVLGLEGGILRWLRLRSATSRVFCFHSVTPSGLGEIISQGL
jgi:hypothetical protein